MLVTIILKKKIMCDCVIWMVNMCLELYLNMTFLWITKE